MSKSSSSSSGADGEGLLVLVVDEARGGIKQKQGYSLFDWRYCISLIGLN